jgi:GTP-binding protein
MKIIKAEFLKSVVSPETKAANDIPEVSFIGRSNVGKSSAINKLLMHKIARTSSTPGRTRAINLYRADYEFKNTRKTFCISDFPGFGYSKVSRETYRGWQQMIESYILQNTNIKRIIWLFDVRRDLDDLDKMLIEWLEENNFSFSFLITKIDKVGRNEIASKKALFNKVFGQENVFVFSAKSGDGRKELLSHILSLMG